MAKLTPITVAMKKAGAAAIAGAPELPLEELVTIVYRAMEKAQGVPVYRTRAIKGDPDGAFVIDWPKEKKLPKARAKVKAKNKR